MQIEPVAEVSAAHHAWPHWCQMALTQTHQNHSKPSSVRIVWLPPIWAKFRPIVHSKGWTFIKFASECALQVSILRNIFSWTDNYQPAVNNPRKTYLLWENAAVRLALPIPCSTSEGISQRHWRAVAWSVVFCQTKFSAFRDASTPTSCGKAFKIIWASICK